MVRRSRRSRQRDSATFEDQHGKALAARQEVLVIGGKGEMAGFGLFHQLRPRDAQDLKERAVELGEKVPGAEGVLGVGRQGEAEGGVALPRRAQVPDRQDEVINATAGGRLKAHACVASLRIGDGPGSPASAPGRCARCPRHGWPAHRS